MMGVAGSASSLTENIARGATARASRILRRASATPTGWKHAARSPVAANSNASPELSEGGLPNLS